MYATIRIQMGHARNALLLRDALPKEYQVIITQSTDADEAHAFDLCILDEATFGVLSPQVQAWKAMVAPLFLPVLFLCEAQHYKRLPPVIWDTVDEVLSMPVSKTELLGRIRVLLRARQSSVELQEMVLEVEETQAQLAQQTAINARWMGTMLYDALAALGAIHRRSERLTDTEQPPSPTEQSALLQAIEAQSAYAVTTIQQGLENQRLPSAEIQLRPTETTSAGLFEEIVAQHERAVIRADSSLQLILQDELPARLYIDPLKFEQLMGFLLRHAAEASPSDTQIEVSLTTTADALRLCLRPHTPGHTHLPSLFPPSPQAEEPHPNEDTGDVEATKYMRWQMFHQLLAAHGGTMTYSDLTTPEGQSLMVDFPLATLLPP